MANADSVVVGGVSKDRMKVLPRIASEILMGKLDQHFGPLDSEVNGTFLLGFSPPTKMGPRKRGRDVLHPGLGMGSGKNLQPGANQFAELLSLAFGEIGSCNAPLGRSDSVIPGTRIEVLSSVPHDGRCFLLGAEAVHEFEGSADLQSHGLMSVAIAPGDLGGLSADEGRGQGHRIAVEGEIEGEVVPVELPTPRCLGRGRAEDEKPVIVRTEKHPISGLITSYEEVVAEHDPPNLLKPRGTQRCGQEPHQAFQFAGAQVGDPDPGIIEVGGEIAPDRFFGGVEGEVGLWEEQLIERLQELVRRAYDGFRVSLGNHRRIKLMKRLPDL